MQIYFIILTYRMTKRFNSVWTFFMTITMITACAYHLTVALLLTWKRSQTWKRSYLISSDRFAILKRKRKYKTVKKFTGVWTLSPLSFFISISVLCYIRKNKKDWSNSKLDIILDYMIYHEHVHKNIYIYKHIFFVLYSKFI